MSDGPGAVGRAPGRPPGAPQGSGVPPRPTPLPTAATQDPTAPQGGRTDQGLPRRPGADGRNSGEVVAGGQVAPRPGDGGPDRRSPGAAPSRPVTRPVQRSRRARLSLRRIDPWSVFVLSLLVSLFLGVVTIVAGLVLYNVLDQLGVPKSVNTAVTDVKGGAPPFTSSRFVGLAALLAAVNVVLLTALATFGALLYNLCASFTGGIEVTLAEGD